MLKVEDESTKTWKAYLLFVDKIIVEGFVNFIQTSFNFFLKETDHVRSDPDPLFEIQLRLDPPDLMFMPPLEPDPDEPQSFIEIIEDLINSIYKQASLIKRIADHIGQTDYQVNF